MSISALSPSRAPGPRGRRRGRGDRRRSTPRRRRVRGPGSRGERARSSAAEASRGVVREGQEPQERRRPGAERGVAQARDDLGADLGLDGPQPLHAPSHAAPRVPSSNCSASSASEPSSSSVSFDFGPALGRFGERLARAPAASSRARASQDRSGERRLRDGRLRPARGARSDDANASTSRRRASASPPCKSRSLGRTAASNRSFGDTCAIDPVQLLVALPIGPFGAGRRRRFEQDLRRLLDRRGQVVGRGRGVRAGAPGNATEDAAIPLTLPDLPTPRQATIGCSENKVPVIVTVLLRQQWTGDRNQACDHPFSWVLVLRSGMTNSRAQMGEILEGPLCGPSPTRFATP